MTRKRLAAPDGCRAFRYRVFGLTIESAWELPLVIADAAATIDVRIVQSQVEDGPSGLSVRPWGSLLVIPSVAKYRISGGALIEVEPLQDGSARNVRLYLLGSAIGALLHQRGILPLHANAIDLGGAAAMFLGHSGAGKSTLAAWFHDNGYAILADDICTVEIVDGQVQATPGIPRLRLWKDALESSGRSPANYDMSFDDYEKYDVPTAIDVTDEPLPLIAIYTLAKSSNGNETSINPLRGVNALEALIANTYRGSFLTETSDLKDHLHKCVELSRSVPIFEATRPWGLNQLETVNRSLEMHALEILREFRDNYPAPIPGN